MVPEDEVSLRVIRDDLGRGVANEGGGEQQRDDLGGENLAATQGWRGFLFMGSTSTSKSDTSRSLVT